MREPAAFWAQTDRRESGCWLWMAGRGRDGYGKVTWYGQTLRAHRLAYQLIHGPIPLTLQVCHSCDAPLCVNPAHLWVGTHRQNHEDCTRKGRRPTGERHGSVTRPDSRPRGERCYNARLTRGDVDRIRAAAAAGTPIRKLAADFGLNLSHTYRVVRGEKWRPEWLT